MMLQQKYVKVAIDLTPLLPGGENGGAKILVLTLLRFFKEMAGEEGFEFLLITEPWNHEELSVFQDARITCCLRENLTQQPSLAPAPLALASSPRPAGLSRLPQKTIRIVKKISKKLWRKLPTSLQNLILTKTPAKKIAHRLKSQVQQAVETAGLTPSYGLREQHGVDVLFCPFSAPTLAEEGLPLVAIAYDLQHIDLPFFFTEEERDHRNQFLQNLQKKAQTIICISEFTKSSFLKHFQATPEQFIAVPICIHERLPMDNPDQLSVKLTSLGLDKKRYVFYPANYWPHKNHQVLLAAYSIYKNRSPENRLELVLTGALEKAQKQLQDISRYIDQGERIHFLGFLSEAELAAVWQGCQGLIFPSLYEGFGIPLLEAMRFGKPVACSNIGSLPEVGGEAVLYFDPCKPEEIAQALEVLEHAEDTVQDLIQKGYQRLQYFNQEEMAAKYLHILRESVILKNSA